MLTRSKTEGRDISKSSALQGCSLSGIQEVPARNTLLGDSHGAGYEFSISPVDGLRIDIVVVLKYLYHYIYVV